MNNEHLRRERFHKPTGLKNRNACVKNGEEKKEREKIEHGTEKSEDKHEPFYARQVPFSRRENPIIIDGVGGNGELRRIVNEICKKNLHRNHWEKWEIEDRSHHTEHVSKIRTQSHHDVLHGVAE